MIKQTVATRLSKNACARCRDSKICARSRGSCHLGLLVGGCEQKEIPKKVNLDRRAPLPAPYNPQHEIKSLKFGFDLRLGPKEDVRIYQPFLLYLEQNVEKKFSLRFSEKYEDTAENLGKGITHFAAIGPVNSILAKRSYGIGCLVMGLNSEGKPEYRAALITRIDSQLRDIDDLRGKSFAFGDRFSTQGHVIPRQMLEESRITLKDLKNYVFSGSHANTARLVLNGEYDAGGIQDTLAQRLSAERKVKILAISKPYPCSLICYTKDVDPAIVRRVKAVLLSFDPMGKHAAILKDWDRTEMPHGFTEYQKGSLAEIKELCDRYGLLK